MFQDSKIDSVNFESEEKVKTYNLTLLFSKLFLDNN